MTNQRNLAMTMVDWDCHEPIESAVAMTNQRNLAMTSGVEIATLGNARNDKRGRDCHGKRRLAMTKWVNLAMTKGGSAAF